MNASRFKSYTIPGVDSMTATMTTPLQLAPVGDKATLLDFDGGRLSSDGGLVLLNDPDEQLGFTRDLAAVLRDPRDPRRVDFTLHDLLKQHVLQIAATLRREIFLGTPWVWATMETIQLRVLKLGARVQECTDRIKIALPSSCPVAPVLRRSLTLLACVRLPSQAL
jgi:hypothetical protein